MATDTRSRQPDEVPATGSAGDVVVLSSHRISRETALRAALPDGAELHVDADTARPQDVTARMNFGYVVSAVVDNVTRARRPQVAVPRQ